MAAAAFYLDFMIANAEGQLVTSPSPSPENTFFEPGTEKQASVCEGSAMDQTMIRELFDYVLEGSRILGEHNDLLTEVAEALPKIAMPKIGSDGRMLEFGIEAEEPQPEHRHNSHIYGVHPGGTFTPSSMPKYF